MPPAYRHEPALNSFRRILTRLEPGIISGIANDDPSSIGTYSVVGAQFGTSLLWTAFITWPLIAAIQITCARIGSLTGKGLASALGEKLPRPIVAALSLGLLVANTITVGADLSAMADATEMLGGLNSHYYVIFFGVMIALATVLFRYRQIVNLLKWFALSLFTYVLAAFVVHPNWKIVLRETLLPCWPTGHVVWAGLVAICGATISPYVFFWQASQESEENGDLDPIRYFEEQSASTKRIRARNLGVAAGSLFSNLAMYFIILTTALTLHRNGITNIDTSRDAAAALTPLAGPLAATLFTVGIVGVGLVSIPILITSAAYGLAETFCWKNGLNERFKAARPFYSVIILSIVVGIALDFADVSPMKALYWSAIVNGVLAPFVLIGILVVASDRKIMRQQPSSFLSRLTIAGTALAMLGAAVRMFVV